VTRAASTVRDGYPRGSGTTQGPVTRCSDCSQTIRDTAYFASRDSRPLCESCYRAAKVADRDAEAALYAQWGQELPPLELADVQLPTPRAACEVCGRPIAYGTWRRSRLDICSSDCWRERVNRRRRVAREPRDCAACGRSFTPTRRDAAYCSSACRQNAYRRRRA
jgi:hypothetical protein